MDLFSHENDERTKTIVTSAGNKAFNVLWYLIIVSIFALIVVVNSFRMIDALYFIFFSLIASMIISQIVYIRFLIINKIPARLIVRNIGIRLAFSSIMFFFLALTMAFLN